MVNKPVLRMTMILSYYAYAVDNSVGVTISQVLNVYCSEALTSGNAQSQLALCGQFNYPIASDIVSTMPQVL